MMITNDEIGAQDLKSRDHCGRAGSSPAWGTITTSKPLLVNRLARVFWFLLKHY